MKIAMLDPANLTPFYSYALCEALVAEGNEVSFFSTHYDNDPKFLAPAEIDFNDVYFPWFRKAQAASHQKIRQIIRGLSYLPNHFNFYQKIEKNRPDVVHIQWALLPKLDCWLVKKIQSLGIPVVLTVHDVNPLFNYNGDEAIAKLFQQVDRLIVHYSDAVQVLKSRFNVVNTNKISVIPHGPLQSENIPQGMDRKQARDALGIDQKAPVITFFGEVKHYKGLDLLVKAMERVAATYPECVLLMAGKPGQPSDIPDLSQLNAKKIQYQANFSFIPNDDVWKYYLAGNIVALPYRDIGQSGVLFSALAHERYVLCTEVGGLPELLEQVGGGKTIPREDVDHLADTLIELLGNTPELDLQAQQAKVELFKQCSWEHISQLTMRTYSN